MVAEQCSCADREKPGKPRRRTWRSRSARLSRDSEKSAKSGGSLKSGGSPQRENVSHDGDARASARSTAGTSVAGAAHCRAGERERELKIEETRAQTAELERSALIQTLVTMRQERGGAMVKNGKGKGKPNSAEKVSSQSVFLEERQTVRVTVHESGAAVTWRA